MKHFLQEGASPVVLISQLATINAGFAVITGGGVTPPLRNRNVATGDVSPPPSVSPVPRPICRIQLGPCKGYETIRYRVLEPCPASKRLIERTVRGEACGSFSSLLNY